MTEGENNITHRFLHFLNETRLSRGGRSVKEKKDFTQVILV